MPTANIISTHGAFAFSWLSDAQRSNAKQFFALSNIKLTLCEYTYTLYPLKLVAGVCRIWYNNGMLNVDGVTMFICFMTAIEI